MVALEIKLPAIVEGEAQPTDTAERVALAQMCYKKQLRTTAARFWTEAFQDDARLGDDMQSGNRYNAACSAALAGEAKCKDNPPPGNSARSVLRQQALDWLKADPVFWSKQLENGLQQSKTSANQTLHHWKTDPDLAGIRDPEAPSDFPRTNELPPRLGLRSRRHRHVRTQARPD